MSFHSRLASLIEETESESDKADEFEYIRKMVAEQEVQSIVNQLHQHLASHNYDACQPLLSRAKHQLLQLQALIPNERIPARVLKLARDTLELGALVSIRLKDAESFTRYFQQLQPFYSIPEQVLPRTSNNASKITGLYLLLLLSSGDYAGFHTQLERLAMGGVKLEDDECIQYPIRLEQALMEGSYDRVWSRTMGEAVPSEEFKVFSEVCFTRYNQCSRRFH